MTLPPASGFRLALASASPRRRALLQQIGLTPDAVLATDIDEAPLRDEAPRQLALRLAESKARAATSSAPDAYILAADTVVAVGRRILPKAETEAEARACLRLLSGRKHDVFTAVSVISPDGRQASRVAAARVAFKRLSQAEQDSYIACGEWSGKAGGYGIQGRAGAFATGITGTQPAIMGLPLYETVCLLEGLGFPVSRRWSAG